MHKLALALLGATALSFGSAADASITVSVPSGSPFSLIGAPSGSITTPTDNISVGFGSPSSTASLADSIFIADTLGGFYKLTLTTGSAFTFTNLLLRNAADATVGTLSLTNTDSFGIRQFSLSPPATLLAGTYHLFIEGSPGANGGSLTGTIDVSAVPEPGTWAFMLLGFAGMGIAVRRSRKQGLAQLA